MIHAPTTATDSLDFEAGRMLDYRRRRFSQARDIAPIPEIRHKSRRELCDQSLFFFLETHHKQTFYLPWSDDHLEVIDQFQKVITEGGLAATAMPRGTGKTSLALAATEWAVLSGRRRFPLLISADAISAMRLLSSIRVDLQSNPTLLEDYPEVCYPIARLENIANRARGQLLNGVSTQIQISRNRIVLPTVEGSPSSGCAIEIRGLTASLRGLSFKRSNGEILRPDLVLLDDPQTDESAKSGTQVSMRMELINGAVLGLAGPSKKISSIATVTTICPDDLADRLLDREQNPDWQGIRHKLTKSLPDNLEMWEEYGRLRAECLREGKPISIATDFYLQNQTEMDRGSKPSWFARKNPDEVSATQHVMNLWLKDQTSFFAEYQNQPLTRSLSELPELTQQDITSRVSNIPRGIVPDRATRLTMGIDIQQKVLYYGVLAHDEQGTCWAVDWGCFPEQRREYFSLKEVTNTLQKKFASQDLSTCVYAGLEALTNKIKSYKNESGVEIEISKTLIDAAWGQITETVRRFCERNKFKNYLPAFGKSMRKASFSDPFKRRVGDKTGTGWRIPKPTKAGRHVIFDANYSKSELRRKLSQLPGSVGSFTLFGSNPKDLTLIADHLLSEQATTIEINNHQTEVWDLLPGRDNHLLDCFSMALVAASIDGLNPVNVIVDGGVSGAPVREKKKKISLAELAQKQIEKFRSQ